MPKDTQLWAPATSLAAFQASLASFTQPYFLSTSYEARLWNSGLGAQVTP